MLSTENASTSVHLRARSQQAQEVLYTIVFVVVVAYAGFGDGLNYWHIRTWLNLQSPLTFVLPLVMSGLLFHWLTTRRLPGLRPILHALLFVGMLLFASVTGVLVFSAQNVLGLLQLAMFGALLVLVRAEFAAGGHRLVVLMVRSLVAIHYFLCTYVVASYLGWHLMGMDLNVHGGAVNEYYGFRPSGFGYEPSWTAFGIAATFTGIFYLAAERRLGAFLAMAVAFMLLTSMTGYVFLVIFTLVYAGERRDAARFVAALLILAGLAIGGFYVYRDRIATILSGADASILMRFSSARIAVDIIAQSFPLGVGYGNFQSFADYADPTVIYGLQEGLLGYYKSDMFVLNVIAELGVMGVLCVVALAAIFFSRKWLPPVYFLILIVASGTVLVQATLVLAAVVGALDRERGMLSTKAALPTT